MTHIQQPTESMAEGKSENVTIQSPYMTKEEVAKYFRCSITSINRMVKNGMLKATKIPRYRRVLFDKRENPRIKD